MLSELFNPAAASRSSTAIWTPRPSFEDACRALFTATEQRLDSSRSSDGAFKSGNLPALLTLNLIEIINDSPQELHQAAAGAAVIHGGVRLLMRLRVVGHEISDTSPACYRVVPTAAFPLH
jgi:hypothetical protein